MANKAPLERQNGPSTGAEDLVSFEDFVEITCEGTFVASQEDSDVEPEVEPICAPSASPEGETSSNDEITAIPENQCIEPRPKQRKWCKMKLDPHKFYGIEPELVNEIQWDVDGTHIFKMFVKPDRWIDTIKDGRWYKMNTSQLKRLNGLRKTGRCAGSIICKNIGCSKLQTEGILNLNPSDFHIEHGCHVCNYCGYYAIRVYCGCKKAAEYDF